MRTTAERRADNFDAELYRLVCQATQYQDEWDNAGARSNPWREVVGALYAARPHVRSLMHKDDLAETV
jgi:hypothetical protein